MATLRYGIPGIGGSLGMCAVCGESFLKEIMLGESVDCIKVKAFGDKGLPVHRKCGEAVVAISGGEWQKLPPGPMRDCFAEEAAEMAQEASNG